MAEQGGKKSERTIGGVWLKPGLSVCRRGFRARAAAGSEAGILGNTERRRGAFV